MKYALLINDRPGTYEALPPDELESVMGEYMAISQEDAVYGGSQLHPAHTATTVRANGGGEALVTDGPFADTKEFLGGFFLVDVEDLDAALAIARRIPATRLGGSVEVRPVVDR